MKKTIALIACGKNKLPHAALAKELYIGELFKKARKYSENVHSSYYILSALHGLVDPNECLEPYNYTLNDLSKSEVVNWSNKVHHQLQQVISVDEVSDIYIYAGKNYRNHLVPLLLADGYKISLPLEGLGIGEQLSWFKSKLGGNK